MYNIDIDKWQCQSLCHSLWHRLYAIDRHVLPDRHIEYIPDSTATGLSDVILDPVMSRLLSDVVSATESIII